ncbi:DUF354 domain-containing protein [Tellurirhabdus bombi]|uniref:DUF354 domain-containing protein n=1 Tax=Tellurirhabdus bombi TaxID=2907205 RepID=UPI001F41739E|nr:DUF354 domain-containing protein [Tellurirhabdus bombi]
MKLLIDIGHPAHVHYFRNVIHLLQQKGHQVAITARDKEVSFKLLQAYNLPYSSRGRGAKGLLGKLFYLLKGDLAILKVARQFQPDLCLSFGSPYLAQVSKLINKPHIAFDDTEHARYEHAMYLPFTDTVVTPTTYWKELGQKQIRYKGFIELCHLAPPYFQPNPAVLDEVGLTPADRFVILRFVSWSASHDRGQSGISYEQKIELVQHISHHARILISSEGPLPTELEPFRMRLSPEKLHDLLAFASLYIGEGGTTANECAILGIPNILISSLLGPKTRPGIHNDFERYRLQELFMTFDGVLEKALALLKDDVRSDWQQRRQQMLSEKIDVTAFMVWLMENYPSSLDTLKNDPNYQENFRLALSTAL